MMRYDTKCENIFYNLKIYSVHAKIVGKDELQALWIYQMAYLIMVSRDIRHDKNRKV